jgi:hypothetical protein
VAEGAIILTWGSVVPGRESLGLHVFAETVAYWEALETAGRITSHREFLSLTGNTSKRTGMMVIEGEVEELLKISTEDASHDILARAGVICNNLTMEFWQVATDQAVGRFVNSLGNLGLIKDR